ncbi:MAG: hypothetical protein KJ710_07290 [Candidatus Omnitrophica bacterium]|nr:hypothetical protein [Candidatus Omnitrophota bacterium]MBU1924038.1 hypothetical protein [Candidatus Omnitrophota bacterium]
MDKKQPTITLVILLHFSIFAHAGIIYSNSKVHHKEKPGEFASLSGVFNFKLGITTDGEFTTQRLFSSKTILKNVNSGEFRSPTGIFNQGSNEFMSSGSIFEAPKNEFSADRLISSVEQLRSGKKSFKSSDQGEFKFSLPREKDR